MSVILGSYGNDIRADWTDRHITHITTEVGDAIDIKLSNLRIGVVGLGYVGFPVAIAFAKKFDVIGFDIDHAKISYLKNGDDWTNEIPREEIAKSTIKLTTNIADLSVCNFFVVAVPTPIDENRRPDVSALRSACKLVGSVLRPRSIVVFESTVYPGVTEDICGPELEQNSGLICGKDFTLAYSPERINPGDREHSLEQIVKIISGQDQETLDFVSAVYLKIIRAGVFQASSIKVAEAAKILENTQRDINIALMNEISKICDRLNVRTTEVLAAAATKWNFMKFTPGLVGGHCIGVDPYYLTFKAEQIGFHPEIILAGRRINDGMASYIASRFVQLLIKADRPIRSAKVGILGITFKEDVPDIRNSKVVDLYKDLEHYGIHALVCDPVADSQQTYREYEISLVPPSELTRLDGLILAVPHACLMRGICQSIVNNIEEYGVVVDIKGALAPSRLRSDIRYWSL